MGDSNRRSVEIPSMRAVVLMMETFTVFGEEGMLNEGEGIVEARCTSTNRAFFDFRVHSDQRSIISL